MARKSKKLDLGTAEQADGALPPVRSAYELMGIRDTKYREKTFAAYQKRLREMDLAELHDHAYDLAVVPNPSAQVVIQRLEEKYLRENSEQRNVVNRERAAAANRKLTLAEQAERVMAQGA